MRVADAAKVLGVGEQRVRTLIRTGRLKATKNELGHYDVDASQLEAFGKHSQFSLTVHERMERVERMQDEVMQILDTAGLLRRTAVAEPPPAAEPFEVPQPQDLHPDVLMASPDQQVRGAAVYVARIRVLLRSGVSDPQGQTVESGLCQLGFQGVESVRVGKYVEVRIEAADDAQAERTIGEMCDRLLANPVIEDYSFELERYD